MLYTKPINEISWQDVVDFCGEGHFEGPILEYKRNFSDLSNEKLAKTVAALANTYGGLLIIGVNAPSGKPIAPFEGFDFDSALKYEEKVESVVLSHIREPVFPEVKVCEPKNGRTFIVIRVAESSLTPHRVSENTKIYVRTGQSSTPNEEATWDKIEWLASRRKESEELRKLLIEEGERYFRDACKIRGINPEDRNHYFATISLRVIPLFPQGAITPFKVLDKIENDITVRRAHGGSFPYEFYENEPIQNGVRKLYVARGDGKESPHGKTFEYIHLTSFGLYLYKRDIGDLDTKTVSETDGSTREVQVKGMNFYWISDVLHQFLMSAALFYKKLGYWGSVQLEVELANALGVPMPHPLKGQIDLWADGNLFVPSDHLKWEKKASYSELKDHTRDLVVEITDAIAWSLGVRYFTEERIRKHFEKNFGSV